MSRTRAVDKAPAMRSLSRASVAALVVLLGAAPAAGAHTPHLVTPGETLSGIAAAAGVSTASLAAANGLAPDAFAIEGTTLQVPGPGEAPAAPAGVSTAALAAANGLSPTAFVIEGTTLRVPAAGSSTMAAASSAGAGAAGGGDYRVRLGDSLSAVAARHGVGTAALAQVNGLAEQGVLLAGTVLRLPGGGTAVASPPSPAPAPSGGPVASGGRVTAGEVSSIAAQHGVPGSLAAAIAWQESGFNNSKVSVADARGVMQILPGTWDWIRSSLAGGRPLDPASPQDNVRAGSMFLSQLLKESGGDPAMAAAGYYQGMASVRRIGMLPTTRQYVANVLALRSRFGG